MILLDLFCGAGGATKGYQRAGFRVVGIDHRPQPRYCGDEFREADALDFLREIIWNGRIDDEFVAIHASPPCQRYSAMTKVRGADRVEEHPDLVAPTRELLNQTGLPYVIENVVGAPLVDPIKLCGQHFGLAIAAGELRRHRLFESNVELIAPARCRHPRGRTTLGIYGGGTRQDTRLRKNTGGGNTQKANKAQAQALLGINWMTREEMCQSIPPAYTEWIGRALVKWLGEESIERNPWEYAG